MVIVEVGGTVGDIESLPFLEAIRQMRKDQGRHNVLYVHVTLLPALAATGELKTKPTQHSVKELRGIGIQPDVIVLRSDSDVPDEIREKIALFTDVDVDAVIPAPTASTIYEVPLQFEAFGLRPPGGAGAGPGRSRRRAGPRRLAGAGGADQGAQADAGDRAGRQVHRAARRLPVGDRGPPPRRPGPTGWTRRSAGWTARPSRPRTWTQRLAGAAGVLVPGGFGHRGIEGKVLAAHWAREQGLPYLGLCLGLQCAVIEFAREVIGTGDVNSTEFDMFTANPVIDFMPDQRDLEDKGGTMRLGLYPAKLLAGSKARAVYGTEVIYERHRHRFEVNNRYRQTLETAGMLLSGTSPDGRLVEIVELRDHPWFVASQFHPEFKSRPERPHPLFHGFVATALALRNGVEPRLTAVGPGAELDAQAAAGPDREPEATSAS